MPIHFIEIIFKQALPCTEPSLSDLQKNTYMFAIVGGKMSVIRLMCFTYTHDVNVFPFTFDNVHFSGVRFEPPDVPSGN